MSTTPASFDADAKTVSFHGVDGRQRVYAFAELPLPALHTDLVQAFIATVEQVGTVTTADLYFASLRRFLSFLDALGEPIAALSQVQPRHFAQYRASRSVTVSAEAWYRELSVLFRLLRNTPYGSLSRELGDQVTRPGSAAPAASVSPGPLLYSPRELERLVAAARQDAGAVRDRVVAGEKLLAAYRTAPDGLTVEARTAGMSLDVFERMGRSSLGAARTVEAAERLFVTARDLAPLLVLGTVLTGLRPLDLHDLPADHRVTDHGHAVTVDAHRARHHGQADAHWAVRGDRGADLDEAGDFYLLMHRLTERARAAVGSDRLWCVWTASGCRVASRPALPLLLQQWAMGRHLSGDDGRPLALSLQRLRSTLHRAVGG